MSKFKIYDWAGNLMSEKTFDYFDDAWDYILGELTEKNELTEEDYQEYSVERVIQ
jgi:hypothetical protein